jgi:1,4-alpha-glucan branching enzyme
VAGGVFDAVEMPQGATAVDASVYFVVHAPHAAWAALVLVDEHASGGPATRTEIAMSLTPDTRYWWCHVLADAAPPGARYHFVLDDDLEVIDPAAREVQERGSFDVAFGADPNDASTAWAVVLDTAAVMAVARAQPWQTMGWQTLLIYEMHARRFTDRDAGARAPFDLLVDELGTSSRLGQPGYLGALPVTAFELLPVQEFSSAISWGYDPSFYFAVDGHYGGAAGLARFVDAAHRAGRGVLLDVVYNHSLGSPLMRIAPDVYRNGDYDGDRTNCGHPMVLEHLRQATVHLLRTFGLDGFRFDDTKIIANASEGGEDFLRRMRDAVHTTAAAEGRAWPYCVAENCKKDDFDVANPGGGVMDGQWATSEVYCIRDASYDTADGTGREGALRDAMNAPSTWGRPFYEATRFGESHDMVSGQDWREQRIAARPPFGQGLQMAKALGTLTLLSNGVPMLFMGQEVGETAPFLLDASAPALNPQQHDAAAAATDNARVLAWFRRIMGLRNDGAKGLQGDANYQVVATGYRTVAFTCGGGGERLFVVVTFGTGDVRQDSSWLGLPGGGAEYKEIFNSSWPAFQVEFETERANGGYDARITSGQILNLPFIGAVVLERV